MIPYRAKLKCCVAYYIIIFLSNNYFGRQHFTFTCAKSTFGSGYCDESGNSWKYTETVDWTVRKRILKFNSCPNHFNLCQKAECGGDLAQLQNYSYEIPLYPGFASSLTDTTCEDGPLAVALNGVPIQGMNTGKRVCVTPGALGFNVVGRTSCNLAGDLDGILSCGNSVIETGTSIDKCGGLVKSGVYHYDVTPVCLIQQLQIYYNISDAHKVHSPQIGWALDGFPVYGPFGPNGMNMIPCDTVGATSPYCLDSCNGLRASLPDVDQFRYRYYTSGPMASGDCSSTVVNVGTCARKDNPCCLSMAPPLSRRPYTIGCFAGCPANQPNCILSGENGVLDTYLPVSMFPNIGVFSGISSQQTTNKPTMSPIVSPSSSNTTTNNTASPTSEPVAQINAQYQQTLPMWRNGSVLVRLPPVLGYGIGLINRQGDLEYLPNGAKDSFALGLSLGSVIINKKTVERLFFASHTSLYYILLGQNVQGVPVPVAVVKGIFVLTLQGYNFNVNSRTDSYSASVTVSGVPCLGIEIIGVTSSTSTSTPLQTLQCTITGLYNNISTPTANDVTVSTKAGVATGIDLKSKETVVANTHRPSVITVDVSSVTCHPYAIAAPISVTGKYSSSDGSLSFVSSTEIVSDVVYWSNLVINTIHRSHIGRQDGLLDTVAHNLENLYGLVALRVTDSQPTSNTTITGISDILLCTSSTSSTGIIQRITISYQEGVDEAVDSLRESIVSRTVLNGLIGPRGLAVDISGDMVVVSTLSGHVYRISLSFLLTTSTENLLENILVTAPQSKKLARRLLAAATSARLDGVSILPIKSVTESWNQQRIFITDYNLLRIWILKDAGGSYTWLSLSRGGDVASAAVPRGIVASYRSDGRVVLYVSEYLGKIWEVELHRKSDDIIDELSVPTYKLLVDWASFAAAERIRKELTVAASPGAAPIFLDLSQ